MAKRVVPEMTLPQPFLENMQRLLADEYEAFLASYAKPSYHGLRVNRLKIQPEAFRLLLPYPLNPVNWCAEGFTYPDGERPSRHWAYRAGLFYIQEPSAMCPASVLNAKPGDRVLDLCAAPGGKSVQLAGQLGGSGWLLANDASASRCRALIKNLEMAGVTNAVVLNETPKRLAERFTGFFDRILVDAPCSGEGMFRRDPDAAKGWVSNKPDACVGMQREILHYAAQMLKKDGQMVYSTCTFEPEENEYMMESFLAAHADFSLLPIDHAGLGLSGGELGRTAAIHNLQNTARIWPHKQAGEGHFIALLTKNSSPPVNLSSFQSSSFKSAKRSDKYLKPDIKMYKDFCEEYLSENAPANLSRLNRQCLFQHERSLFYIPEHYDFQGLRVARGGWLLGDIAKDRFIPSQALAMAIRQSDARFSVDLQTEDTARYLRGESFMPLEAAWVRAGSGGFPIGYGRTGKPWVLVCTGGYSLGWARLVDGRLKNHLPQGWVMT